MQMFPPKKFRQNTDIEKKSFYTFCRSHRVATAVPKTSNDYGIVLNIINHLAASINQDTSVYLGTFFSFIPPPLIHIHPHCHTFHQIYATLLRREFLCPLQNPPQPRQA